MGNLSARESGSNREGEGNNNQHLSNNEILITQQSGLDELSLNIIIRNAPDGALIRFEEGEYLIKEKIILNKSIKLIGAGIDKTIIKSRGLDGLLESSNNGTLELGGISFISENDKSATVAKINVGNLSVKACSFSGGVGDREGRYGTGLYVGGTGQVEINQCRFEDNQDSGLWLDESAHGVVVKNEFRKNDSGLAVTGNASVDTVEDYFTENHVGAAYDQFAKGEIRGSSFIKNRAGILVKGNSTASVINNKFNKNDGGIGLAENCDVRIEGNEISEGQFGLRLRHEAKAIVSKNQIQDNQVGISCTDRTSTKILNNEILRHEHFGILAENHSITHIDTNTISGNAAAIKFDDMSILTVENNHIISNSLYGILAKSEAKGSIHKNIIKKNIHWNVDLREGTEVDFDNFTEPVPQGRPVEYSFINDQILINAPIARERYLFNDLITHAKPNQVIVLENGEYILSEPILISKPVQLIARTSGEVTISGEDLPALLVYDGEGKLILKGIRFSLENHSQTNVITVKTGELEINQCSIEGGRDPETSKRDFGAGLILLGTSVSELSNSIFKNNFLGISLQDHASARLNLNQFTENGYGIVFRDISSGRLSENQFFSNAGYGLMAYDDSRLICSKDSGHNNKAGFGFINNSKATVENAVSYENEYHGFFIDNDADCIFKNNKSYSNEMSGIAIYGDSQTLMEENELYENGNHGFEIAENAKSTLRNNNIHGNPNGIYLGDTATVIIAMNDIYENGTGININNEATAIIENNKMYQNSGEAIDDSSEKESTICDNEIFDNGEEKHGEESNEDNDEFSGFNLGDLIAQMLGSENLSKDPNTAVIPISNEMLGLGNVDEGEDKNVDESDEDVTEDE